VPNLSVASQHLSTYGHRGPTSLDCVPQSQAAPICRLIQLTPAEGDALLAQPDSLKDCVAAAKVHSDVYRYWHGIQFLLGRHRLDTPAAQWLDLGRPIRSGDPSLPDDRLIIPTDVAALNAALRDVAPDDLAEYYDARAMDAAKVYPGTWQVWEEDFDPLGQVKVDLRLCGCS